MMKWLKENWDALTYADRAGPTMTQAMKDDREFIGQMQAIATMRPATERLRANLEREATAYLQREQNLQREIADREAELADVRRARDAATAGLLELEGALELEPIDPAAPYSPESIAARMRETAGVTERLPHD